MLTFKALEKRGNSSHSEKEMHRDKHLFNNISALFITPPPNIPICIAAHPHPLRSLLVRGRLSNVLFVAAQALSSNDAIRDRI